MKFFYKTLLSIQFALIMISSFCLPAPVLKLFAQEKRYCDDFYADGGQAVYVTETLDYDYYLETQAVYTSLEPPKYTSYDQLNSCAPTAGAIAIGYYDFYFSNLVPNFDTYYYDENDEEWYPRGTHYTMVGVMGQLYTAMGTNVGGDGTTISGFMSGMNSYVTDQGYSFSYVNMGSSTTMISNCISAFNNDQIVVLFLDSYEYIEYSFAQVGDDHYSLYVKQKNAGHVVIATGFLQLQFYENNQLIHTLNFFEVAFGNGGWGFLKANDLSTIDAAYKLVIS